MTDPINIRIRDAIADLSQVIREQGYSTDLLSETAELFELKPALLERKFEEQTGSAPNDYHRISFSEEKLIDAARKMVFPEMRRLFKKYHLGWDGYRNPSAGTPPNWAVFKDGYPTRRINGSVERSGTVFKHGREMAVSVMRIGTRPFFIRPGNQRAYFVPNLSLESAKGIPRYSGWYQRTNFPQHCPFEREDFPEDLRKIIPNKWFAVS